MTFTSFLQLLRRYDIILLQSLPIFISEKLNTREILVYFSLPFSSKRIGTGITLLFGRQSNVGSSSSGSIQDEFMHSSRLAVKMAPSTTLSL